MSTYTLVTSTSCASGMRHSSESDQDSVLDGVLCDTCMDIVILMSRTALGAGDRFHVEKTQDLDPLRVEKPQVHSASRYKTQDHSMFDSFLVEKPQDHSISGQKTLDHSVHDSFRVEKPQDHSTSG